MRNGLAFGIAVCLLMGATLDCPPHSWAKTQKKWTITERQEQLNKEIDKGEKSNELTAREAELLRGQSLKITTRISKMKIKNDGKLTYDNINEVEKLLNKLSLRIQKLKLNKRVQ